MVYYFEPYGGKLRASNKISKEFESTLGARDEGWRLESIEIKLQTDGHSCGVWILVVDRARLERRLAPRACTV